MKTMVKIIDISGVGHEVSCIACSIQSGEINLPVERIAETNYFVAEQDFEYPIEGFLIIASKRHIKSVADFTEIEQEDFIKFLVQCRRGMKEFLGIEEVTLIQEETSSSSHFHVWLFPWLPWMSGYKKKISSVMEIMEMAKKERSATSNIEEIKSISKKLKQF